MNLTIPLMSLLILNFTPVAALNLTCATRNDRSVSYQLRENDRRCEGVQPKNISSGFEFVSFTLGNLKDSPDLSLQVPDVMNGRKPVIHVLAEKSDYQLDPIDLPDAGDQFKFQWSNAVLNELKLNPNRLRATAKFRSGSQLVYAPVRWDQNRAKTTRYNLVFVTGNQRLKNLKFEIHDMKSIASAKLEPIYTESRSRVYQKGAAIPFTWNGKNQNGKDVSTGRYRLEVEYTLGNSPSSERSAFIIYHDPKWLKP